MGEMAEDAYDRALDEIMDRGYGDDFDEGIFFGRSPGLRQEPIPVSCPDCGTPGLLPTGRGADRYLYKPGLGRHICHVAVKDDFDDLDDLSDLL